MIPPSSSIVHGIAALRAIFARRVLKAALLREEDRARRVAKAEEAMDEGDSIRYRDGQQ